MSKKLVALGLVVIILLGFGLGCSQKEKGQVDVSGEGKKTVKNNNQKGLQEPQPDPINEEQKKNPLPDGSKAYTGIIKKIEGGKVVLDIDGTDLAFTIDKATVLQKGTEPGKGKIEELHTQMKINVLVMKGIAMTVHYE